MYGDLTRGLLKRGDRLAVSKGQLIITPKSGELIPQDWFATNKAKIIAEIAQQSNQSIFAYSYYTTGIYNKGRSPGVTLRFIDLLTGEGACAIFNAQLKYQRTTRKKKAGDPLPDGHFNIGDRSAFYMLWIKTPLDIPRRFSEWHKAMSKLRHVYFVGERSSGDKLANKSIQPLSLSHSEILDMFGGNLVTSQGHASDNLEARNGDKEWRQGLVANNGDKHIAVGHTNKALEPDSKHVSNQVRVPESAGEISACTPNRVLSNQVMTCNVVPLTPIKKKPEEQSVEEWLHDYNSAN
jgi:hypothetical protein